MWLCEHMQHYSKKIFSVNISQQISYVATEFSGLVMICIPRLKLEMIQSHRSRDFPEQLGCELRHVLNLRCGKP